MSRYMKMIRNIGAIVLALELIMLLPKTAFAHDYCIDAYYQCLGDCGNAYQQCYAQCYADYSANDCCDLQNCLFDCDNEYFYVYSGCQASCSDSYNTCCSLIAGCGDPN
jgi:hypothetical protein